ncbi:MAG: hypothetical protein WC699_16475 [Bacteroidales bacterium]|jgi:hypothetical protein
MPALLDQLNKVYFWDIDPALLDDNNSKRLIIERIMNYGNLKDIQLITSHYGLDEVKTILCSLNYIDPKTLNFISLLFHIPKTRFKCYSRKLSTGRHWSF